MISNDRLDSRWAFHYTTDPLTRYLRDRRLKVAMDVLRKHGRFDPTNQSVLVACGGVGGEGTFFADLGFQHVAVSDVSEDLLADCRRFDPRLTTFVLDAEDMAAVASDAYDVVLVQDGLHHLGRPTLGFTEMLRIARVAAIVIEPHWGMVGRVFGTTWEADEDHVSYVFRWNSMIFSEVAFSFLGRGESTVEVRRLWDHNVAIRKVVELLPQQYRLVAARGLYGALTPANRAGNMMVGVVIKARV